MRRLSVAGLLVTVWVTARCAPRVEELGLELPLTGDLSYVWSIRAWHADELWVPVGDSLDLALLRDRCGVPVGHGLKGCFAEEDSTVRPRWSSTKDNLVTIRPLTRGSWRFGPASAGARVYGHRQGVAPVVIRLPQGAFADTIRVVPGFARLRIEPRDSTYVAGDTVWFRVSGLDPAGRTIARLPWPLSDGRQAGPPAPDGAIPIVFETITHPSVPTPTIVVHIGSKTDTLRYRVVAGPKTSGAP